jgi:hypothetical protein
MLPRCISQQPGNRSRSPADLQKMREEVWRALSKETEVPGVLCFLPNWSKSFVCSSRIVGTSCNRASASCLHDCTLCSTIEQLPVLLHINLFCYPTFFGNVTKQGKRVSRRVQLGSIYLSKDMAMPLIMHSLFHRYRYTYNGTVMLMFVQW